MAHQHLWSVRRRSTEQKHLVPLSPFVARVCGRSSAQPSTNHNSLVFTHTHTQRFIDLTAISKSLHLPPEGRFGELLASCVALTGDRTITVEKYERVFFSFFLDRYHRCPASDRERFGPRLFLRVRLRHSPLCIRTRFWSPELAVAHRAAVRSCKCASCIAQIIPAAQHRTAAVALTLSRRRPRTHLLLLRFASSFGITTLHKNVLPGLG